MISREKFEAFLVSEYEWGNDALNAANFHGDDATGYYTGGDFIYDGQSCSECLFWAWRGWQAAELAAEKKLTDMAVQLANAESKCRELAAENATMKERASDVMKHVYRSKTYLDSNRIVDAIQGLQYAIERKPGKTPSTDAFLAEVRASAVDEACLKISNAIINCYQDEQIGLDAAATICGDFAAQLRKGAAL
ncbi:TPA: hypothetical protein ON591_001442 [Citrobacter freundii]|uniref:hypothetical protein n=1 Tax=Citrobacter freundii complex sp. 2024EL-00217 TaxID=3374259 RepID=UPI0029455624|nr:hypothetical protein [Citrobacter freundii]HCR3475485.1 hypothetical protein [Citrobacter freundii]HED3004476.1 hypothetical protein [Citrobacter freundii]